MQGVSWNQEQRDRAKAEGKGLFCIAVDGKNIKRAGMTMHGLCTEEQLNAIHEMALAIFKMGKESPLPTRKKRKQPTK